MTKNLREEVNIAPYVDRGVIDVHDESVRDNINTFLNGTLKQSFLTPYIALERVRKVLANFHIHIPGTQFLEGDHDHMVFPANQFGDVKGMKNNGEVVTRVEQPYFIYFEYKMNDRGMFDIFCELVTEDELEDLMDDASDDMNDEDACDDREDRLQESSESVDMAGPETGPKPYPNGPKISAIIAMAVKAKKAELEESHLKVVASNDTPKPESEKDKVERFKNALSNPGTKANKPKAVQNESVSYVRQLAEKNSGKKKVF